MRSQSTTDILAQFANLMAEYDNYFHPDFVVCVKHNPADEPMMRLPETKEDTNDASRKSQHSPESYGEGAFLDP
ncbi:MAG: hypothetical protein Q7K57_25900 [Burkholderiaceae bacterium]|nr:hypothetical protein [Burkholderiaceae bacterium]